MDTNTGGAEQTDKSHKKDMKELESKLEEMKMAMESEKMEAKRLRQEIMSYRTKFESEQKQRFEALQESQDVQVMNRALVKEHQELLSASQTSSRSSEDRDKHVEELTASVRVLKERLLGQNSSQLTDQILGERQRTKKLMASCIFWKTTDLDPQQPSTTASGEFGANRNLEVLFQSVLQEGRLHMMFNRCSSGPLFDKCGGGCRDRDCLYIAILPERTDGKSGDSRHHCVLSDDTIIQLKNSDALIDVIVANIVELRYVQINDEISVFVATAGEIFHPQLV